MNPFNGRGMDGSYTNTNTINTLFVRLNKDEHEVKVQREGRNNLHTYIYKKQIQKYIDE